MHPTLLAALKDRELSDSAKSVLSYLYANTNGVLAGAVFIDEICADLRIAEPTLRRRRAELAEAGYLASDRSGDRLQFELAERAPTARSADPNAHLSPTQLGRAPYGDRETTMQRAPSARCEVPNAHLVREAAPKRAPSARSAGNPFNLIKLSKEEEEEVKLTSSSSCLEGGLGETNDRIAQLLRAAGVAPGIAGELAGRLTLEAVARHIAAWQIDRDVRPELGVGALVTRLRTWDMPLELHADDLTAGLLADHITETDLHHWRVKRKRPKSTSDGYRVPAGYEGLVMR